MPGPANYSRGNIDLEMIISVNIAAGTVGTTTQAIVTVAVAGLVVGDYVQCLEQQYLWAATQPALQTPVKSSWVATNGVLSVAFTNISGAAITQTTALAYLVDMARSYNFSESQTYPTAIV